METSLQLFTQFCGPDPVNQTAWAESLLPDMSKEYKFTTFCGPGGILQQEKKNKPCLAFLLVASVGGINLEVPVHTAMRHVR